MNRSFLHPTERQRLELEMLRLETRRARWSLRLQTGLCLAVLGYLLREHCPEIWASLCVQGEALISQFREVMR